MRKIIYYVAISLDGYIAGDKEDISYFTSKGNGVDQYVHDLQQFKTVIMGKNTYEFGYKFGMKPGDAPYPHMDHYIFSNSLHLESANAKVHIKPIELQEVDLIVQHSETDIYLCGGGIFAGWLLNNQRIDILKLKVNPILLGTGIRLFENSKTPYRLDLLDSKRYDDGLHILTYSINY